MCLEHRHMLGQGIYALKKQPLCIRLPPKHGVFTERDSLPVTWRLQLLPVQLAAQPTAGGGCPSTSRTGWGSMRNENRRGPR